MLCLFNISIGNLLDNLIINYVFYRKNEKMKMKYTYDTEFWEDNYYRLINRLSAKKYSFIDKLLD